MRCMVSCGSTSFPWLVFFFGDLLRGSMIYKHTFRWTLQGHLSRILELKEMLLSFQTGFNLVNTAVVRAILVSISCVKPSSVITESRHLKHVIVSNFCPYTLIPVLMPLVLFVISLAFLALISMRQAVEGLSRRSTNFASSSSSQITPIVLVGGGVDGDAFFASEDLGGKSPPAFFFFSFFFLGGNRLKSRT